MTTGFLYDPRFLNHDTGAGHPESAARLTAVMTYLESQPWFARLKKISPRAAELAWIETVHSASYIKRVKEACEWGARTLDTPDVAISEASYETALLAAGAGLVLADSLMKKEISNGFALVRPPGHHAEKEAAMGFCLFNNAAILARYLQKQYGLKKILILDWDVHHGNGTQHMFEDDPSVFYISTHEFPFYPGTGAQWETGSGKGKGATLNCPMPAGAGDRDYEKIFREKILPEMEKFQPDAILISAGFDAHESDPLAHIRLRTGFYGWMTERVMEIAHKCCEGRVLSLLEGGYDFYYLPRCIETHLNALSDSNLL